MAKVRSDYINLAEELEDEMTPKILSAPVKRGWNNMFKVQIPSARDLKQELINGLQYINEMCVNKGFSPIYLDPEDKPEPKVGTIVK
tara:strand:- start:161 stop:421 length:261 start_codon:yes stop_codon:yes gene_type:complete